ncbi:hypothetical protein D9M71_604880 [compost metagenome]
MYFFVLLFPGLYFLFFLSLGLDLLLFLLGFRLDVLLFQRLVLDLLVLDSLGLQFLLRLAFLGDALGQRGDARRQADAGALAVDHLIGDAVGLQLVTITGAADLHARLQLVFLGLGGDIAEERLARPAAALGLAGGGLVLRRRGGLHG